MPASLNSLRKKIDALDSQIVKLLNARMAVAVEVGEAKRQEANSLGNATPIYQPAREAELLERLRSLSKGNLSATALEAIYREILSASKALQQPIKVAYLGPASTFTHQAALQKFGHGADLTPCVSIGETFAALEKSQADYAVVPVENSTEGSVSTTLDLLAEGNFTILSEIYVDIAMQLISEGSLTTVKKIYSKDVAFGQCRRFLSGRLPNAELVAVDSTTKAVELAKGNPEAAAIAGLLAAQTVGVPILERNIQDKAHNATRFFVLAKASTATLSKPLGKGRDKSSYVIAIKDKPGALLEVLKPFQKQKLNLTKLESRPSRAKAWEYVFYVDLAAHQNDPKMKKALAEVEKHCQFVKHLGSYPKV